jgi:hypothetical protein
MDQYNRVVELWQSYLIQSTADLDKTLTTSASFLRSIPERLRMRKLPIMIQGKSLKIAK